jgi:creatinine amidohydrolase
MERQLQKLTWLKVQQLVPAEIDTVVLPVGTVEGHGSSCLGTDNLIPETIAEGIVDRINGLVAPIIPYGVTRSLYRYNGGVGITSETFETYVREVVVSFTDTGFRNVIILNGHGGNNSALKSTAHDLHRDRRVNVCVIHWWELCGEITREFFGQVGGHGGIDETAMVQAVDNDLVDTDAYDPEMAYYVRPGVDVYPVPGTILLYKEGEGYPDFNPERAREFHRKVITEVGAFVEMVLARWRKCGL